jgi:hypothetical protein
MGKNMAKLSELKSIPVNIFKIDERTFFAGHS